MKKLISIFLGLLVCVLSVPKIAYAADYDLDRRGSLTISFSENYPLQGSEYAIWHVAEIQSVNGPYKYVNTEPFATVHLKWTNEDLDYWDQVDSAPLISFVGEYIDENNIEPYAVNSIGESNECIFEDLPLGIYYVRQTSTGPEGYVMTSYLATIPDGNDNYDVTSDAKTDPYGPDEPEEPKDDPTKNPNINTDTYYQIADLMTIVGIVLILFPFVWKQMRKSDNLS